LPAGVVALFGVADIRALGISLDTVLAHPDRHWEHAVPLTVFGRLRRFFRACTRRQRPPPEDRVHAPDRRSEQALAPEARPARVAGSPHGNEFRRLHAQPGTEFRRLHPEEEPLRHEEGRALLEETKQHVVDEQGRRTANRVAELFLAGQARKRALREARAAALRGSGRWSDPGSSSSSAPAGPRKRRKWYAVRKGRTIGIFDTWEECEKQTKGVASEFRSFPTLEEAKAYLTGRRFNFMAFRRRTKPESSFIGGEALRAQLDVWQDGHADCIRVECGFDTMSDVNLAVIELLHDVHDIVLDDVRNSSGKASFAKEGTLKVLYEGEVLSLPALVATTSQLPRSCSALLGIPGLNQLGVSVDRHREKQRQPLMCYVGEKTLRKWWEANEGQAVPAVVHDITQVDVCPDLPAKIQAKVRELLRQYEGVFEGRQVTMPKPFQAEPVELKFIDNPVPQSVPEPRWTHRLRTAPRAHAVSRSRLKGWIARAIDITMGLAAPHRDEDPGEPAQGPRRDQQMQDPSMR
jgi:hypothetical protein